VEGAKGCRGIVKPENRERARKEKRRKKDPQKEGEKAKMKTKPIVERADLKMHSQKEVTPDGERRRSKS
jgi:hypothetical protein